jgi:hypothetical protein
MIKSRHQYCREVAIHQYVASGDRFSRAWFDEDYLQFVSRLCQFFPGKSQIVTVSMNFPWLSLIRVWVLLEKEEPIRISSFRTPYMPFLIYYPKDFKHRFLSASLPRSGANSRESHFFDRSNPSHKTRPKLRQFQSLVILAVDRLLVKISRHVTLLAEEFIKASRYSFESSIETSNMCFCFEYYGNERCISWTVKVRKS